ncbi:MAG TPA: hypothetical protein PKD64_19110, partial [Pirellulaceae bacterium]|nr:hypothetical protein [Pirellulaceae bacterium]
MAKDFAGILEVSFREKHSYLSLLMTLGNRYSQTFAICGEICGEGDFLSSRGEQRDSGETVRRRGQTKESRVVVPGLARLGTGSSSPVVFMGHFQKLCLGGFPIAGLAVLGKFAESFVAKRSLVPAFGPSQPVVQAVEFRFAFTPLGGSPTAAGPLPFLRFPTPAAAEVAGPVPPT